MSVQPALDVVEAFNTSLMLSGEDVQQLEQSAWRLAGLWRRDPAGHHAALGLVHARQMLGQRDAAIAVADELWGRRAGMGASARHHLATLEAAMGRYDRALTLVPLQDAGLSPGEIAARRCLVDTICLGTWDREVIRRFGLPGWSGLVVVVGELDRIGLLGRMEERQTVVNRVVVPHQCSVQTVATTDGHADIVLIRSIYVGLDYAASMDVTESLALAETRFYGEAGVPVDEARYLLTELLLPAQAQLPGSEGGQIEPA